jgi:hypothetical protein
MTRAERKLLNRPAAMLKFIEALIVNSNKFGSRSKSAQRHYSIAQKLVERARKASAPPPAHRGPEA